MSVSHTEPGRAADPTSGLVPSGLCPRQSEYVGELFLAVLTPEKFRAEVVLREVGEGRLQLPPPD